MHVSVAESSDHTAAQRSTAPGFTPGISYGSNQCHSGIGGERTSLDSSSGVVFSVTWISAAVRIHLPNDVFGPLLWNKSKFGAHLKNSNVSDPKMVVDDGNMKNAAD